MLSLRIEGDDSQAGLCAAGPPWRDELAELIGDVHAALVKAPIGTAEPAPAPQEPAISVRKSVTSDFIVCLDCGKKFKSLKRHLRTDHNLTPPEYRAKWSLRADYPMVAPSYAEARSALAKTMGLGRKAAEASAEKAPARKAPTRKRAPKAKAEA